MQLQVLTDPATNTERRESAALRVCSIDELPMGLGRAFEILGPRRHHIALFRTRRGEVFATNSRCPHKGGPLAEGMLAGDAVVCPLHAFRFDLRSGQCDQAGTCALRIYPVSVRDNDVYVVLPEDPAAHNP